MTKTLLVLAASRYQLEAIKTAKHLGMRVITTDNAPDNPGHILADRAYAIDTTEREAVLTIARAEGIDGIISPCTDVAVTTAAYVAERLGLPGTPLAATLIATNKIAFRHFLRENGLPCPRFFELSATDATPDEFSFEHPWIVKPDRSSGSKGVFIVRTLEELGQFLPLSRAFSVSGSVVLEEFIEGHQGTCEGFLRESKAVLRFILDRQTPLPPFVTTTGHRMPTRLAMEAQAQIVAHIEVVFGRLGIRDGVFDCDFVWSRGQVYLLEMTPRLGGNSISRLLRHAAGVDIVEPAVQQAVGDVPLLPVHFQVKPMALVLLGVWNSGQLTYDTNALQALKAEPWVHGLEFDVPLGAAVQPFVNGRHRLGEAYVSAEHPDHLPARERELRARLAMRAL